MEQAASTGAPREPSRTAYNIHLLEKTFHATLLLFVVETQLNPLQELMELPRRLRRAH